MSMSLAALGGVTAAVVLLAGGIGLAQPEARKRSFELIEFAFYAYLVVWVLLELVAPVVVAVIGWVGAFL